jgi:hypothetical protein
MQGLRACAIASSRLWFAPRPRSIAPSCCSGPDNPARRPSRGASFRIFGTSRWKTRTSASAPCRIREGSWGSLRALNPIVPGQRRRRLSTHRAGVAVDPEGQLRLPDPRTSLQQLRQTPDQEPEALLFDPSFTDGLCYFASLQKHADGEVVYGGDHSFSHAGVHAKIELPRFAERDGTPRVVWCCSRKALRASFSVSTAPSASARGTICFVSDDFSGRVSIAHASNIDAPSNAGSPRAVTPSAASF